MPFRITKRTAALILLDVVATYLAYFLASFLTRQVPDVIDPLNEFVFHFAILSIANVAMMIAFRLYNSLWEYASIDELIDIVLSVICGTLLGAVVLWIVDVRIPIRVYIVAAILLVLFMGGYRMVWRIGRSKGRALRRVDSKRPRTLVVGAGETGSLVIERMASKDPLMPGIPVVAVDDNPDKRSLHIHSVKVAGIIEDIPDLVKAHRIEQIVIAIPSATPEDSRRIYGICTETDCVLKTLPNIRDIRIDEVGDVAFRDVDVMDLLGRDEVVLDTRVASSYLYGRTVLVTGGGGSIGSELCRQLAPVGPKRLVVFDIYENDAYMLQQELKRGYPEIEVIVEIGSICDEARVNEVFDAYRPAAVFHAAAHKHVPLMESSPREAIQNNVFGTLNVVRAANRCEARRFTFISTDKAVNPTSVMGATKRMGEMIIQYYARTSKTVFAAVRFGNVLGSNGSVIPVFKRQIAAGGPVTVTHPDIERFFMTIPEATRLVIQAGGMANGGEIFILDMGEPVKIDTLAKNLIRLSGLTLGVDVSIEYTGLRPGEKMYEELLMHEESTRPTGTQRIMISTGQEISYDEVAEKLEELRFAISGTDEQAIELLAQAVPTYTPTPN